MEVREAIENKDIHIQLLQETLNDLRTEKIKDMMRDVMVLQEMYEK